MIRLVHIIINIIVAIGVSARHITEQQALSRALQYLSDNTPSRTRSQTLDYIQFKPAMLEAVGVYAFNRDGGGYVIASADSRALPVLGYSEKGNIDWEQMPDNMRWWITSYDNALKTLDDTKDFVDGIYQLGWQKPRAPKAAVEPLIKTTWYQTEPYWNDCPLYDGAKPDFQGKRCVTGCVATAMAQVMNYYKWPKGVCVEIPAYDQTTVHENEKKIWHHDALPPVTFDWDNMANNYDKNSTKAQQEAVAKLMSYCGHAVYMQYSPESSGSDHQEVVEALVQYFGYYDSVRAAKRIEYSIDEWEDLIYGELAEGRPVQYGGETDNSGHSFVCDGYDGNGFFHINWGWNGNRDGYFSLSVLNPYNNSSVGASSSCIGFSMGQDAIIGVRPAPEDYIPQRVIPQAYLYDADPVNTFAADSAYFQYVFLSHTYETTGVKFAFGTCDDTGKLTPLYKGDPADSIVYSMSGNYHKVMIDSTRFAPGEYQILYPMVKFYNLPGCDWQLLGSKEFHIIAGRTPKGQFILYRNVPKLEILSATFKDDPARAREPHELTLTIRNNGETESTIPLFLVPFYYGSIAPEEITPDTSSSEGEPMQCGAYIRPGSDSNVTYSFNPMGVGTVCLILAMADGTLLDYCFVDVADSISSSGDVKDDISIIEVNHFLAGNRQDVTPYIDFHGRRLQGLPPRKGIYIRNGRKYLFRN